MILFLTYQEWANVVALIVIAVVAFAVLFAGSFIQLPPLPEDIEMQF